MSRSGPSHVMIRALRLETREILEGSAIPSYDAPESD
jgi:hypothetical protein